MWVFMQLRNSRIEIHCEGTQLHNCTMPCNNDKWPRGSFKSSFICSNLLTLLRSSSSSIDRSRPTNSSSHRHPCPSVCLSVKTRWIWRILKADQISSCGSFESNRERELNSAHDGRIKTVLQSIAKELSAAAGCSAVCVIFPLPDAMVVEREGGRMGETYDWILRRVSFWRVFMHYE